jgi:hypothetical protein
VWCRGRASFGATPHSGGAKHLLIFQFGVKIDKIKHFASKGKNMPTTSTGFQDGNQNYNLPVFLELATLSAAAYSTGDFLYQSTSRIGWKVFGEKSVNSTVLESHVIAVEKQTGNKKEMAISFEGTGSGTDIVTDLTIWGFSFYYKSLRTIIESWVRKGIAENYDHIYFTGQRETNLDSNQRFTITNKPTQCK